MQTSAYVLLVALCAQSALGSGHYHGPLARPTVLESGYLADTHEVAAARGAHIAALADESHRYGHGGAQGYDGYGYGGDYSGSYGYSGDYGHSYGHEGDYSGSYGYGGDYAHSYGQGIKYHGPTAVPHVLKNGHIADTHEVSAARAAHYAAVAEAGPHSGYGYAGDYGYGGSCGYVQNGNSDVYDHSYGHEFRYHGPTAVPHVLKNGHIADSHEVSAAKAHHYAAVAEAKSLSGNGYGHGYSHGYIGHH